VNGFYVSLIFMGIIIIVFALVWIAYDKKKSYDYSKQLDDKSIELVGIIKDAEQMINELNKFSDYIVTQIDLKNQELAADIKKVDERISQLNNISKSIDNVVNGNNMPGMGMSFEIPTLERGSDTVGDKINTDNSNSNQFQHKHKTRSGDKIIPINNKCDEVLQLAAEGLDETEIARKLNIGKGEIQLILGINRR